MGWLIVAKYDVAVQQTERKTSSVVMLVEAGQRVGSGGLLASEFAIAIGIAAAAAARITRFIVEPQPWYGSSDYCPASLHRLNFC